MTVKKYMGGTNRACEQRGNRTLVNVKVVKDSLAVSHTNIVNY